VRDRFQKGQFPRDGTFPPSPVRRVTRGSRETRAWSLFAISVIFWATEVAIQCSSC
jgi:hypothetical protein